MRIENPVAFSFILQDDLYLLNSDKIARPLPAAPVTEPAPALETPALNFNYAGKLKKHYLIVVFYPGLENMPSPHSTALENTLKRLDVSLDDVGILNLANYKDATFDQLSAFFKPEKLLILGQLALPSGLEAPKLNQQAQLNNCRSLFTFSFDEMMNSNDHKKIFWEQMKLW